MEDSSGASGERTQSLVDVRLARDIRAPVRARRAVEALRSRLEATTLNDLKLLVSELVTNSVRHAGPDGDSWVRVRLTRLPGGLRVEVTDPGPGFVPEAIRLRRSQHSGRGLYLVGAISDRWGVDRNSVTRVWFEIAAPA